MSQNNMYSGFVIDDEGTIKYVNIGHNLNVYSTLFDELSNTKFKLKDARKLKNKKK